ncbi:MAG: selenocysteine-specific translation elongation factor [Firmicutes bacterium]|nr:selenocysteine-specific translation elongation factor [Bacillota bacterium]
MRPVIFGTAGHIDHGKTELARALTGINTDRLPEEQSRGITIDLGFAHFILPSGRRAALIDVPGHERFVRNMVAGVHGMDAVILVVAADEGVMPQTREHLDILQLLGVRRGVVVLSKADLVDADWLAMVEETVREELAGSFLEGAPLLAVDSLSGRGLPALREALDRLAAEVPPRPQGGHPRLPVDRVFTVRGFGTVVTGTLVSGTLRVGQAVTLSPGGIPARIRGLEVHNRPVPVAEAGQRVAANLTGVEREQVSRGMVLGMDGIPAAETRLVVQLHLLPRAEALRHQTRVHFHTGTAEAVARVHLYEPGPLPPGDTAFAELVLDRAVAALRGDRFLIRSYSPVVTIGGGVILETGVHHRRKESGLRERLERLAAAGGRDAALAVEAVAGAGRPLDLEGLAAQAGLPAPEVAARLEAEAGVLHDPGGRWWWTDARLAAWGREVEETLRAYQEAHPLRPGMPREALARAVAPGWEVGVFAWALGLLPGVETEREWVRTAGFGVRWEGEAVRWRQALTEAVEAWGLKPEPLDPLLERLGIPAETGHDLADRLTESGALVRLEPGYYVGAAAFTGAVEQVRAALAARGELTTSELREVLGVNRRWAVPLLEMMDQRRITRRLGDRRGLLP